MMVINKQHYAVGSIILKQAWEEQEVPGLKWLRIGQSVEFWEHNDKLVKSGNLGGKRKDDNILEGHQ